MTIIEPDQYKGESGSWTDNHPIFTPIVTEHFKKLMHEVLDERELRKPKMLVAGVTSECCDALVYEKSDKYWCNKCSIEL